MTVQDKNAPDLVPLYELSNKMGMEFATASLHNSFSFVEAKNIIPDRPMVAKHFANLVNELLKSNSPKKWFLSLIHIFSQKVFTSSFNLFRTDSCSSSFISMYE